MSDNNQLAINPYVAGGIGAVVGGAAGQWMPGLNSIRPIKEEYNSAQNLLTLEADKFEALKPAEDAAQEVRDNYDTFVKGRQEIADAEKAHKTNIETELETHFKDKEDFKIDKFKYGEEGKEKTIAELQQAVTDAEGKVELDKVEEVKKARESQAAAEKALAENTDDTKKANLQKAVDDAKKAVADAEKKAKAENADVKAATETLEKAKADRIEKMKAAVAKEAEGAKEDSAIAKLAKKVKETFDPKAKAKEMVDAKDSKYAGAFDKVKGLLKRTTWKAAAGLAVAGAAIGAAIAYIVGPKNDVPSDVA